MRSQSSMWLALALITAALLPMSATAADVQEFVVTDLDPSATASPSIPTSAESAESGDQVSQVDLQIEDSFDSFAEISDGTAIEICSDGDCPTPSVLESSGLFQILRDNRSASWTGRVDSLILWRNSPRTRPIFSQWTSTVPPDGGIVGPTVLNADQLESTPAAGPRFSLFRDNGCGHILEATYFRAFNFRSQRALPPTDAGYTIQPYGIYGNTWANLDSGSVNLGSSIQSLEINGREKIRDNISFLFGIRWVEWQESISIQDQLRDPFDPTGPPVDDFYNTGCTNSLYGGQIGVDVALLILKRLRVDGLVKAGAYANNAVQNSAYQYQTSGDSPFFTNSIRSNTVAGAFVGEVGINGTIPLTNRLDFTFGYLGVWLESIAQPTQQLGSQVLTQLPPPAGAITTTGGAVVQGLSLGLQGRW
ncbi:MAG: BBP7 family outer membrane beta-barrel protein [Planctomycetota bacterium]